MSYRQRRNGSWVVEVYNPRLKRKVHVRARDHGAWRSVRGGSMCVFAGSNSGRIGTVALGESRG